MAKTNQTEVDKKVPLRERLERLQHVRIDFEDRQLVDEAEEIADDDPGLVAWALVVLLRWQE